MEEKNPKIIIKNNKFRKITFLIDHLEIIESIFSSKQEVPYNKVAKVIFEKHFYSQFIDDCMTIDYSNKDGKKEKIVIEVTEKDFLRVAELIKGTNITIEKKSNY